MMDAKEELINSILGLMPKTMGGFQTRKLVEQRVDEYWPDQRITEAQALNAARSIMQGLARVSVHLPPEYENVMVNIILDEINKEQ